MLYPHVRYKRITDIPVDLFLKKNIRGLILDVDNTMTTHDNMALAPGVAAWLEEVKRNNIKLIILSNNSPQRVAPMAKELSIEFEADARKPLGDGYYRACKRLRLTPHEVAAIGDQIFTDVLGARLAGIYCVFVDYIKAESGRFFWFKRMLERPILSAFERKRKR